ncbi:hypothetical protein Tco_0973298 [Tanacetum coccineum]
MPKKHNESNAKMHKMSNLPMKHALSIMEASNSCVVISPWTPTPPLATRGGSNLSTSLLHKGFGDRRDILTWKKGLEVDIIKKTENQAKMTKLSMEWKRLCKIKAKVQKCQSQSQYRRISSQTGAGTEEYY